MTNHRERAIELALLWASERKDRNIIPRIVNVDEGEEGFILVDVAYAMTGKVSHCALYEYRIRDGHFSLAQD